MTSDLAVPRRQVAVRLALADGTVREGRMFLDPMSPAHSGPQTLPEYLDGSEAFVPLESEGQFLFVPKGALVVVTEREDEDLGQLPWDAPVLLPDDEAPPEVRLSLGLKDGRVIEGDVVSALPPEKGRLIDYLNVASAFVAIREGEMVHFVNKAYVCWARPLRRS